MRTGLCRKAYTVDTLSKQPLSIQGLQAPRCAAPAARRRRGGLQSARHQARRPPTNRADRRRDRGRQCRGRVSGAVEMQAPPPKATTPVKVTLRAPTAQSRAKPKPKRATRRGDMSDLIASWIEVAERPRYRMRDVRKWLLADRPPNPVHQKLRQPIPRRDRNAFARRIRRPRARHPQKFVCDDE